MAQGGAFIRTREWLVIILYTTLVGAITLITQFLVPLSEPRDGKLHELIKTTLDVSVSGAVAKPDIYILKKGATIGDLLAKAEVLAEADISKIKLTTRLTQGRHIHVPKLEKVTIRIEGEVESPITMTVAKGTRLKDLFGRVHLKKEGDPMSLMKQRTARDGETITIRRKKDCKKT